MDWLDARKPDKTANSYHPGVTITGKFSWQKAEDRTNCEAFHLTGASLPVTGTRVSKNTSQGSCHLQTPTLESTRSPEAVENVPLRHVQVTVWLALNQTPYLQGTLNSFRLCSLERRRDTYNTHDKSRQGGSWLKRETWWTAWNTAHAKQGRHVNTPGQKHQPSRPEAD